MTAPTEMPRPIREFQNIFLPMSETMSSWMAPLSDRLLDNQEALRNRAFCFLIYVLLDVQRTARPDLERLAADREARRWAYLDHYLEIAIATLFGAGRVLSVFSREEQIAMIEHRHQLAHGHRRGVLQDARRTPHFADGNVVEEQLSRGDLFEILNAKWGPGGPDEFCTAMRCKLGPQRSLFWELLGGWRVLRAHGFLPKDINGATEFDPRTEGTVFRFASGGYDATEAIRADTLPSFFEVCRNWGPTEDAPLDPFVDAANQSLGR